MKLLTYLAEIIKDIRPTDECKLSVLWLVRMVQKMVNYEVVNSPSSTVVVSFRKIHRIRPPFGCFRRNFAIFF